MKLLLMLLLLTGTFACSKDDDPGKASLHWTLVDADVPATGVQNTSVPIKVYYPTTSGSCDWLDTIFMIQKQYIVQIKAYGHTNVGGICTADAPIKTRTFNMVFAQKGDLELQFINKDGTYFSRQLRIE